MLSALPVRSPVTLPVTLPVIAPVTLPVTFPVKFPVTLPVKAPLKAFAVTVPIAVKSPPVFILKPVVLPAPSVIDCNAEAKVPLSPTFNSEVYVLLIEFPVNVAIFL